MTRPRFNPDTPRGALAQRIATEHPTWRVTDYPTGPDQLGRGQVYAAVYRRTIAKHTQGQALEHEVVIDLYVAQALTSAAEDEGDDRLDDLLITLAAMDDVTWSTAERHTFDALQGWRVTCTVYSTDVYAAAARRRLTA